MSRQLSRRPPHDSLQGFQSPYRERAESAAVIDALIGGKLYGKPEQRESRNGNAYVTCKVRAPAGDGEGVFVSVIAFAEPVCRALLALEDGDSASIAGELTPKAWLDRDGDPRPGLDMLAHAVTTAYHVRRKRQAVASPDGGAA